MGSSTYVVIRTVQRVKLPTTYLTSERISAMARDMVAVPVSLFSHLRLIVRFATIIQLFYAKPTSPNLLSFEVGMLDGGVFRACFQARWPRNATNTAFFF